jgi:hypothetical protein
MINEQQSIVTVTKFLQDLSVFQNVAAKKQLMLNFFKVKIQLPICSGKEATNAKSLQE